MMVTSTRLPWTQRICYAVGHCLNDLTAAMWFSYLIVYLQLVLGFNSNYAGLVLLIGQVADAVATPLLGYETSSQNIDNGYICKKYGKRKFLHLIGTACVLSSFPFIFSVCDGCETASQKALTIMLIPIVIIFQFGWAATQISHLSLIPVITPYETERDFLNAFRYTVDIIAGIGTYVMVWLVFDFISKPTAPNDGISMDYADKFMVVVILIEITGAFFVLIFHLGVKEGNQRAPTKVSIREENGWSNISVGAKKNEDSADRLNLTWKDWLKEIHFYQVSLLYMLSRLFQNMIAVFIPLYLQESRPSNSDLIAKIPLVINVSGVLASCLMPKVFKIIGKKLTFLLGASLGIGSCAWVMLEQGEDFWTTDIYGMSVLMGIATSCVAVCSLSFIHDLIDTSIESGAFVYGCVSFGDKLGNGVAGMLVQYLHSVMCKKCNWFYKHVIAYGIGTIALLSILVLFSLYTAKLGVRSAKYEKLAEQKLERNSTLNSSLSLYGSTDPELDENPKRSKNKEEILIY